MYTVLFFAILLFAGFLCSKHEENKKKILIQEKIRKRQIAENTIKEIRENYIDCISINFAVKGLLYRSVDAIEDAKTLEVGSILKFEEEPDNIYDNNAIKVLTQRDYNIGYVDAKCNSYIKAMIDDVVNIVVSKISSDDVPFIYAEAFFKFDSFSKIDLKFAKEIMFNDIFTTMTSKYYSHDFKIKKLENVFEYVKIIKKAHHGFNENIVFADAFSQILLKAYRLSLTKENNVLLLHVHYSNFRSNKYVIIKDEWDKVLFYCEKYIC